MKWRLLVGDVREKLAELPEQSVQCVVTSPPYWGLRDYGVPGQLGLEPTPDAYVAAMVDVFRGVRLTLKDDGVVWLNLGDSYAAGKLGQDSFGDLSSGLNNGRPGVGNKTGERMRTAQRKAPEGLKPKDLVGIPWRVAFALQADGWYLRSDIIWAKPNPMPESVQGTHYSRHRVTIDEYERLSGLRYTCECAGNAWAGDMPPLSEGEVSHRKAPLSAESQRYRVCSCQGRTRGGAGEETEVQSITVRQEEPSQVRSDSQGQAHKGQGSSEVQSQSTREAGQRTASSANQGRADAQATTPTGQPHVPQEPEGEGACAETVRAAEGRDPVHAGTVNRCGVGGDSQGTSGSLLLLQKEDAPHTGPRHPVEQGRPAHGNQRGASVPTVQFQETGQVDPSLLVGCPGCPKCIEHHGYTFHLSAGRPTKAHEYVFLMSKSERYFYDAEAIREPYMMSSGSAFSDAAGTTQRGSHGFRVAGQKMSIHPGQHTGMGASAYSHEGRNVRTVWTIATQPYPEAHFATFPEALPERCIKAGSRLGDVVLDPFCGSGTTGKVAIRLGREFVGIELSADYAKLARERIGGAAPLFAQEATA